MKQSLQGFSEAHPEILQQNDETFGNNEGRKDKTFSESIY